MSTLKFMPTVATSPTIDTAMSTTGVRRTKSRPSPRWSKTSLTELGRGSRRGVCSSSSRISDSPTSTARKLRALITKATPTPNAPMVRPAMAGPRTRAPLNIAELSETALPTSSGPTISMANDWRTGMSTALAQPRARASRMTIQSSTTPLRVRTARIAARTIITACTAMSVWRLGRTSASTPANRPRRRTGRNWAADTMPSHSGSPSVSSRTSQAWATCCIQVPTSETAWPVKNSR